MLAGLGAVSGLVLDGLILSAYGVSSNTDALFTATAIPLLIISIFSIQSPKVLIPVFSDYFSRNDFDTAWELLSNLLTTVFCILAVVSLLGVMLSSVIVPVQIPGLEAPTVAKAVWLSQIVFWLVLFGGLASILGAVLYAQERYVVSASGKLLFNTVTITVVSVGHEQWGIQAVAIGMLLGSVVQVVVLISALSLSNFRYRCVMKLSDPKLREIAQAFRYPLVGHMMGESGVLLQNFLSSFLGSGSLTVMRYASRIVQAVGGILLGSVVQVTFSLIAKYAATNDLEAQRKAFLEGVRLIMVVGLPVCLWLILAAEPLVVLLFERGEFTRDDAAVTALLIRLMVPDILMGRVVSLTQTLFYSVMETRTPFVSTVIYTTSHTLLAIVLARAVGVIGLPLAVSLASLSNMSYMLVKVQRRFGSLGWGEIRNFQLRLAAACVLGGVGFVVGTKFVTFVSVSYSVEKVLALAVPTAVSACLFVAGAFIFQLVDSRVLLSIRQKVL